ncbi:MAG: YdbH domain-containing protein [Terricaulis sp.]
MKSDADSPVKRSRLGWAKTLGVVGAGGVLIVGGLWFLRVPLADFAIRSNLAGRGVESDFQILSLDFGGVTLSGVRIGPETNPDLAAASVEVVLSWSGPIPHLAAVRVIDPRVRLRMDEGGRVSLGELDKFSSGGGAGKRPSLPRILLEIQNGQALMDAPFGALTAQFESAGTLGRDFTAHAFIPTTTLPGETYALDHGVAELELASNSDQLSFRLTAAAEGVNWNGARVGGASVLATGHTALDLSAIDLQGAWRVDALAAPALGANGVVGQIAGEATLSEEGLTPATWSATLATTAVRLVQAENTLSGARLNARMEGAGDSGRGEFAFAGASFSGMGVAAASPSATGTLNYDLTGDETFNAAALVTLAQARLTESIQRDMRNALPDIEGTPFGPPVAQAERALDVAMDRFTLAAPVQLHIRGDETRIVVAEPIEARGANGALAKITPLRNDGPTFAMRWPGSTLHAAASVELSGAGLPNATILVDSADWAPDAPFEAEGSVSIPDWRAGEARLAAQEINFSLAQPPTGEGHLDVTGPLRMSGPLGDGSVRDLDLALDLNVAWNNGWRVSPRENCLPVRIGGLAVAGLAFEGGAFSLCAGNGGALIAANAQDQLSGGFVIQSLHLDGRMAGPEGPPARLRAEAVRGVFSGVSDNILLQIETAAPTLAVDFAEDRTLQVAGQRLTADAHIGGGTWRVEGAFEAGTLGDPTLPGDVSAIVGRWSAAPEGDRAVIRVAAGEARVEARTPPPDAAETRPLFHPVRFTDVEATLDQGQINATGRIVLEAGGRELATFTAEHNVEAGVGAAHVVAEALTFGRGLQPYEITELARGVVENVRGPVNATAEINWTQDTLTGTARVRPNNIALAMATIPIIEDVSGEIYFDDFFLLTTPPGQTLTVGTLNPGVAVHNGRIRFQLLPEEQVTIEQAEFDFASGILAVAPTTITLGAEETKFELRLSDVDVAAFLAQMDFKDLQATGHVEGSFPLRLTTRTAFIENGVLRAAPGGGTINYVGEAAQSATGAAAVAFDALRSFRYDRLELTLNGDISGDVVTSVSFSGENTGRPVDLTPVAQLPGVGQVTARGVPFLFNVTVTAPFQRLAQSFAGIADPRALLDQATPDEPAPAEGEPDTQVDQPPPAPR